MSATEPRYGHDGQKTYGCAHGCRPSQGDYCGIGENCPPGEPEDNSAGPLPCDACGAEPHEDCRWGCLGAVSEQDIREAASNAAIAELRERLS